MKFKSPRSLLICFLFSIFLQSTSYAESKNENTKQAISIEQVLATQDKHQTGQFTQKRYLSVLTKPLVSSGHFSISEETALVWALERPFELTYSFDGSKLTQSEFGETSTISSKDDPMLVGFFSFFHSVISGNSSDINTLFEQEHLQTVPGQHVFTLVPKKAFLKKSFKAVTIKVIDRKITEIHIKENEKDRIELTFSSSEDLSS